MSLPSFLDLNNQVAIVTGCGSDKGIGFAICKQLLQLGAKVVMTSTTSRIFSRVSDLVNMGYEENVRVIGVIADLTIEEQAMLVVEKTISTFQKIDILINNAGMVSDATIYNDNKICESGSIFDMDFKSFHASMNRNLYTAFIITKYVSPYLRMKNKSCGRIINISSTTGPVNCTYEEIGYSSAKSALIGFTKSLSLDFANYGVTCNAVCPGWIATASQTALESLEGTLTPLRRSATPEEVAHVVIMLATPGASYITGQMIVIDGGNSILETRSVIQTR